MDLSYPPGNLIINGIKKDVYQGVEEKLSLPSIDKLVNKIIQLGRGCNIFKLDLKWVNCQLFICPGDIFLIGFVFEGKIYYDGTLIMGFRSSASCCQHVSSSVVLFF